MGKDSVRVYLKPTSDEMIEANFTCEVVNRPDRGGMEFLKKMIETHVPETHAQGAQSQKLILWINSKECPGKAINFQVLVKVRTSGTISQGYNSCDGYYLVNIWSRSGDPQDGQVQIIRMQEEKPDVTKVKIPVY